jgi:hypothetical protein
MLIDNTRVDKGSIWHIIKKADRYGKFPESKMVTHRSIGHPEVHAVMTSNSIALREGIIC